MDIIKLQGTEQLLYELVAPLVMDPMVLKQNNNYPFKTSPCYTWFVAREDGKVIGFMPVKQNGAGGCMDNYYIEGDQATVLEGLIDAVIADTELSGPLKAVVHKRHTELFARKGFETYLNWQKYEKMSYQGGKGGQLCTG